MKKVYLVYIRCPAELYEKKLSKHIVHNKYKYKNGFYLGLYAWTTDKEKIEKFKALREASQSLYAYKKVKMDSDEFNLFKSEYSDEILRYYLYRYKVSDRVNTYNFYADDPALDIETITDEWFEKYHEKDDFVNFVSTKNEFCEANEYGGNYLIEKFENCFCANFMMFKDKYLEALDKSGFCELAVMSGIGSFDDSEQYQDLLDAIGYNASYGLSLFGFKRCNVFANKFLILIDIFRELIIGNN